MKKKPSYKGLFLISIVTILLGLWMFLLSYDDFGYAYDNLSFAREPEIISLEPKNFFSIQADNIIIKGEVRPEKTVVKINNKIVPKNKGYFSYIVELPEEKNEFKIIFLNKDKVIKKTLTIIRIFTLEEIAELERIKNEEKDKIIAEEERKVKEFAEWEKTKAGQICKNHSEWQREDCEKIADGKIWIGMSIFMVVETRGNPTSVNVSNYGQGDQRQYCWYRYNPSCFYDKNEDNLVDSYN